MLPFSHGSSLTEDADKSRMAYPLRGGDIPCKVKEVSRRREAGSVWFVENVEGKRVVVRSGYVNKGNLSKSYFNAVGNVRELRWEVICNKNKLNLFCNQFQNNEFCFHTLGPHSQTQKLEPLCTAQ